MAWSKCDNCSQSLSESASCSSTPGKANVTAAHKVKSSPGATLIRIDMHRHTYSRVYTTLYLSAPQNIFIWLFKCSQSIDNAETTTNNGENCVKECVWSPVCLSSGLPVRFFRQLGIFQMHWPQMKPVISFLLYFKLRKYNGSIFQMSAPL